MKYLVTADESTFCCHLSDELVFDDHSNFREMLDQATTAALPVIKFDLAQLEYVDSAGLGMLLVAKETIEGAKKTFILSNANGQVSTMLDLAKLNNHLRVQ